MYKEKPLEIGKIYDAKSYYNSGLNMIENGSIGFKLEAISDGFPESIYSGNQQDEYVIKAKDNRMFAWGKDKNETSYSKNERWLFMKDMGDNNGYNTGWYPESFIKEAFHYNYEEVESDN